MALSDSENGSPPSIPLPRKRFIAILIGCVFVALCGLWSRNFEEIVPVYHVNPVSTLTRGTHQPIAFVWPGWDGISESVWEHDYFRELFPSPMFIHVNSSIAPGVMKCSDNSHVNDILHYARQGHVKVVIQSSDEYGGKNEYCNECFKTFKAGNPCTIYCALDFTLNHKYPLMANVLF